MSFVHQGYLGAPIAFLNKAAAVPGASLFCSSVVGAQGISDFYFERVRVTGISGREGALTYLDDGTGRIAVEGMDDVECGKAMQVIGLMGENGVKVVGCKELESIEETVAENEAFFRRNFAMENILDDSAPSSQLNQMDVYEPYYSKVYLAIQEKALLVSEVVELCDGNDIMAGDILGALEKDFAIYKEGERYISV